MPARPLSSWMKDLLIENGMNPNEYHFTNNEPHVLTIQHIKTLKLEQIKHEY